MIEACVAQVYEAGLNPDVWPDAVRGVSDAFAGAKVGLLHLDRCEMSIDGWARDLDPDSWTSKPDDGYKDPRTNPALNVAMRIPVGTVIDRRAFIDDFGMDRHPMARNFFEPNRMFHLMFSTVQRDPGSASFLFIARRREQAAFEPVEQSLATMLGDHVGRAMRTYRALQVADARTLAFAQALERLAHGVVLADAGLKVLHANPAAERMLEAGAGVGRRLGRLVLGDPLAQQRLERAAARLCDPASDVGDVRLDARRHGRAPLRVSILPAVTASSASVAPKARLLVLIRDPEEEKAPREAALAAAFGLTAAESRVAFVAAIAASTREIAERLGLSENTVKTHLKSVYQKTGARSRADFVRLSVAHAS